MLNKESYLTHWLTNLAQTLIILVSLFGIVGFFAYLLLGAVGLYFCAVLIVGIAFFGGSKTNGELLLSPYQAPN